MMSAQSLGAAVLFNTEELSMHLVDEDRNSYNSKDESSTRLLVQFWDASNGALISNRLFEVKDVAVTRFSPNGHFLAIGRKFENVIKL